MKKSAFISDLIFTFFSASLFTLCLFRYLGIEFFTSILLSIICGALAGASVGAFLQSKRKTFFLKKSEEAQKQKLIRHLLFLSDEGKTKFFMERLSTDEFPAKRFGALRFYTQNALYTLRFSFTPVNEDDVIRLSRIKTKKQKILLCNQIEDGALSLAERLDIKIIPAEEAYALLKERNALPETFLGEESAEKKRKRHFKLWFSRANARRFLLAAILTFLSALLSPFPYYYILFGGVLLLSALCIRIFGYE